MKTIRTLSGDTWDLIAWREWGEGADQTNTAALIEANPQYVETAIFPGNVEIVIPDVEESPPVSIPPWRE